MKKITLLSSVLAISLFAQIELSIGWNLAGSSDEVNVSEITSDECVMAVWTYNPQDEYKWHAYVKGFDDEKLLGYGIGKLDKIDKNQGFWVLAGDYCTLLNNTSVSDNDIYTTLGKMIVNGSEGMSVVAAGAKGGSEAAGDAFSDNEVNYKIVDVVEPQFFINEEKGTYDGIFVFDNIDLEGYLSMKFLLEGNEVNATYVFDNSGDAYGLGEDGLESVMQSLGVFFTGLQNSDDYTSYLIQNLPVIIPQVVNLKEKPLFPLLNDSDLQSFFSSFPTTESEAYSANWISLGSAFAALAQKLQNESLYPDFDKLSYDMSLEFNQSINVDGVIIAMPEVTATGSVGPLAEGEYSMVFKGSGGSILFEDAGITGNIESVEINATKDGIFGKYSLSFMYGDKTYNSDIEFDIDGCKGAWVYDENGNKVMEIVYDGENYYIKDAQGETKEVIDY